MLKKPGRCCVILGVHRSVPGFGISIVKTAVLAGTQLHVVVVWCDLGGVHGPDAIAPSRQHRYLVPPGDGVLRKAVQESANLTPVPCSSTSKRSPLASTNLVCISGIQHIDLIRQYRGAGIDRLI